MTEFNVLLSFICLCHEYEATTVPTYELGLGLKCPQSCFWLTGGSVAAHYKLAPFTGTLLVSTPTFGGWTLAVVDVAGIAAMWGDRPFFNFFSLALL